MVRKSNVDDKDLKILEILQRDSRTSYVKIGKEVGLSEAAIRKRVNKLIRNKILRRFTILVNYKKLGMIHSLTGVDVKPEKLLDVIKKIKKIGEVRNVWLTSGDHTLMLEILTRDMRGLEKIHEKISRISGVYRICPAIILEDLK